MRFSIMVCLVKQRKGLRNAFAGGVKAIERHRAEIVIAVNSKRECEKISSSTPVPLSNGRIAKELK